MNSLIKNNQKDIREICRRHSVERLYIFGSAVNDSFRKTSDIDLLVSFSNEVAPEDFGDNFFNLKNKLESLLERDVDLITERSLQNPYLLKSVNASKEIIYDRQGEEVSI